MDSKALLSVRWVGQASTSSARSLCLRTKVLTRNIPVSQSRNRRSVHSARTLLQDAAAQNTVLPAQGETYQYVKHRPKAPYRVKPGPAPLEFKVNDDPVKLDAMYNRLLGMGGASVLPDDIKWQAVTNKTFDHGFQPYNDKLAFMGRRILFLHANLNILNRVPRKLDPPADTKAATVSSSLSTYLAPSPFEHPDYKNIDSATYEAVSQQTSDDRLGFISRLAGIPGVMRWKPAFSSDLYRSGQDGVAIECLCAIVGAIGLIRGGHEAEKFVRERILTNTDPGLG